MVVSTVRIVVVAATVGFVVTVLVTTAVGVVAVIVVVAVAATHVAGVVDGAGDIGFGSTDGAAVGAAVVVVATGADEVRAALVLLHRARGWRLVCHG